MAQAQRPASKIQRSYNLSGLVRDSLTKQPMPKTTVMIGYKQMGATTNDRGEYSFFLPNGQYAVTFRSVGHRTIRRLVTIADGDATLDVNLNAVVNELEEVMVSSKSSEANQQRPVLGVSTLSVKTLQKLPAALGEVDVLRGLQMLPGVTSVGEASNGVNIRGGTTDQNLMVIDDIPVFNPTHMFGLFSAFPPDALAGVDIYKGNVPARFGGRAASVIDMSFANPSLNKFALKGGISLVSNRLAADLPLWRDKMGIQIATRGAFNSFLLPLASDRLDNVRASFGDVGLKYLYRINNKSTFSVSGYYSNDFFRTALLGTVADIDAARTEYQHSTLGLSARWSYLIRPNLFLQASAVTTDYKPTTILPERVSGNRVDIASAVRYQQGRVSLIWNRGKHRVEGGASVVRYGIQPGELRPGSSSAVASLKLPDEAGLESALYVDDEVAMSSRLTLMLGLRLTTFAGLGPATIRQYAPNEPRRDASVIGSETVGNGAFRQPYGGPEPRFGLRYLLAPETTLKVGYNLMRQYLQVVTNTTTPLPTARWKTSDEFIKPQVSQLLSAGVFHNLREAVFEVSLEGYYRHTQNILEYKPGAQFLLRDNIETEILQGQNRSYGIETMVSKKKGELTGWINYTYSRSLNQINEGPLAVQQVNEGRWYPSNYDRPHTLNTSITITPNKVHTFAFTFAYSTGQPYTAPDGPINYRGVRYAFYNDRNNDRVPDYHRLDFSWNIYQPSLKEKRWKGNWAFTVYNLYGRKNAYSVFYRTVNNQLKSYRLSIFAAPIVSLAYNFTFS